MILNRSAGSLSRCDRAKQGRLPPRSNFALAQIVSNGSITRDDLRQMNDSVKAQLDTLETYVFPEEQTLAHDAHSNTSSYSLSPSKVLASELAGQRGPPAFRFNETRSRQGFSFIKTVSMKPHIMKL
jgi:hypothetical protein